MIHDEADRPLLCFARASAEHGLFSIILKVMVVAIDWLSICRYFDYFDH